MSETNRSLSYLGGGVLILLVALVTVPSRVAPDAFLDVGEAFFPEFTDPNVAVSLEVVDFDEDTASARPFKVTSEGGKWTIPSHHEYPRRRQGAPGQDGRRHHRDAQGRLPVQQRRRP